MATTISDYITSVVVACGAENDIIAILRFDKKDQALEKILKKATLKSTLASIVYDLEYDDYSFRIYSSNGKIVFRNIKNIQIINNVLDDLLL